MAPFKVVETAQTEQCSFPSHELLWLARRQRWCEISSPIAHCKQSPILCVGVICELSEGAGAVVIHIEERSVELNEPCSQMVSLVIFTFPNLLVRLINWLQTSEMGSLPHLGGLVVNKVPSP